MKTRRDRRSCGARVGGFTLIEMLMVIGLIAIFFFGIGIPAFVQAQKAKKTELSQVVMDVQTGLRNARSRAILNQTPMEFVMKPEAHGVQMTVVQARSREQSGLSPLAGVGAEVSPWGGERNFSASFDPNIVNILLLDVNGEDILTKRVDEPEARVRFYPNGICDDFRLILRSPERLTRLITTEVTTGISTVEKVER